MQAPFDNKGCCTLVYAQSLRHVMERPSRPTSLAVRDVQRYRPQINTKTSKSPNPILLGSSREYGNMLCRGYIGILFPYSLLTASKQDSYPATSKTNSRQVKTTIGFGSPNKVGGFTETGIGWKILLKFCYPESLYHPHKAIKVKKYIGPPTLLWDNQTPPTPQL